MMKCPYKVYEPIQMKSSWMYTKNKKTMKVNIEIEIEIPLLDKKIQLKEITELQGIEWKSM